MSRYFIKLTYEGTRYHGWQIQPNGISVQQVIETSINQVTGKRIPLTGCGRTDTGVHARKFYAHFDDDYHSADILEKLAYSLNSVLPDDIAIDDIFQVKDNAHARFDAISRTYRYYFSLKKDPFSFSFAAPLFKIPDIKLLNLGASLLLEYDDFTSFSKVHTQTATNNCKVMVSFWIHDGDQLIFCIKADRFLRNMVRAIVGTLLDVGNKKISLQNLRSIVEQKNRMAAGTSVPAKGLFLEDIEYPDRIFELGINVKA